MDRDNFMTTEEAKDFGLIDEIVVTRPPSDDDEDSDGGKEKDSDD
jgi:ATP-dependent Clp protease protease subunit